MPAADQNAVYVAVVMAILAFMIGFAKGGFGGLGASLAPPVILNCLAIHSKSGRCAYAYFGIGVVSRVGRYVQIQEQRQLPLNLGG